MRKYNFIRPIMLIVISLLVKSLVTNLCVLLGMDPEPAENIGFMAMIVAAIVIYSRIVKKRRR